MFSELVLDHFRNPRNAGRLPNASAEVQATNPVCGDILELAVRIENGGIAEARLSGSSQTPKAFRSVSGSFKSRTQPSSLVWTTCTSPACAQTTERAPVSSGAFISS
jgi:hypothetical protein